MTTTGSGARATGDRGASTSGAPALVELGEVLDDRYRVTGEIGSGGHGAVLLGEHVQLRYPVAIKVLESGRQHDASHRERFRREAILGARVRCANVARVIEAGETAAGVPFLVMELVDGPSLKDVLEGGPLSVAATVDLGIQLTTALTAFARHDLVHRDVKPSNIVLRREPDGRVLAKLVDLGISRHVEPENPEDVRRLTAPNTVIGTPLYMAPEQVEGIDHDARTDIYALSAVLFECLAGQPPYGGRTAAAVLARALAGDRAKLRELRPDVPERLVQLIERGLAIDAAERWPDAATLGSALDRIQASEQLPRGPRAWASTEIEGVWDSRGGDDASSDELLRSEVDPFSPTGAQARSRRYRRWAVAALLLLAIAVSVGSLLLPLGGSSDAKGDRAGVHAPRGR